MRTRSRNERRVAVSLPHGAHTRADMVKSSYEICSALGGTDRTLHSVGGLFSKDKIAKSTELLVKAIRPTPGDRILDYGCGYGAVGRGARIARSVAAPRS